MNLGIFRLKNRLNKFAGFFVIMGLSVILLFTNCNQDTEVFGNNVLPGDDINSIHKDTTVVLKAYTVGQDTFLIGNQDKLLLGVLNDPQFGKTKAGFITQFYPGTYSHRFGTNPTIDSVILKLQRSDYIGDEHVQLTARIFEINDTLDRAQAYFSNYDHTTVIGDQIFQGDMIFDKHTTKMKLPNSFGTYLLNITDTLMDSFADFVNYFSGFYITVADELSNSQLNTFDVGDIDNMLTVYYTSTNESSEIEQSAFSYLTGTTMIRMNIIENDIAGTHLATVFNDTINQDSVFYVQGMGGPLGFIDFSDLMKWKDSSNFAFNKVEITIPVNENYSDETFYPENLILKYFKDTMFYFLPDSLIGSEFMGGEYSYVDHSYSFRITRFATNMVEGDYNFDKLYLYNKKNILSPKRTVLNTGKHTKPMKLNITYTKFN